LQVNTMCEPGRDNVMAAAMALAARITVNAPLAVFEAKKCVDEFVTKGADRASFARSYAGMGELARTPDFKEGSVRHSWLPLFGFVSRGGC
jgi:enoyl-CoA hydratase/carnithine racemase